MARNPPGWLVPVAIVVAGALVGAGLFFGLRGRASTPTTTAAPSTSVAAAPTASPSSPPNDDRLRRVREQAWVALQTHRASLTATCWTPYVATGGEKQATYVLDLSFDAAGTETARAVEETSAEFSRHDVAECLRATEDPITIPAPGSDVTVGVELVFP